MRPATFPGYRKVSCPSSAQPIRHAVCNLVPSRFMVAPKASTQHAELGKTKLGFVGIGIMGLAMTNNLVKAGYDVTVWNRTAARCDPLKELGVQVATSPAAVVEASDITFGMLADPAAALEVALGKNGIVSGISSGKGYVDVSTVDVDTAVTIATAVRGAGGKYLEAPVSGSKGPAEQGTLVFLTAGDKCLYEAVVGPLDVMGKAKFFLGEVGAAAKMKLVVNMVMGSMMAAFAEGMCLADQVGLSQQQLVEVVGLGAIAAPMYALKGPAMAQQSYPTAFPLKHQQKDMRLALALGDRHGQPLPVAAAANEQYIRARAEGWGDQDFSAIMAVLIHQHKEQQLRQ